MTLCIGCRFQCDDDSFLILYWFSRVKKKGETPLPWLALTIALNGAGGLEVVRMQIRPAIEFVSGEDSLRPKSYFFDFSIVVYAFTHALKYLMAPGFSRGPEGKVDGAVLPWHSSFSVCVVLPVTLLFPQKDVFKNLPSRAAALVAGTPRGQLRTWYATLAGCRVPRLQAHGHRCC